MRALLNKLATASMVAGAALVVSACGGSETANTTETTTTVNEMDTMAPVDGSTNDMSAMDGAAGTGNMSADANMTMGANSTTTTTTTNMSGGNMMTNTATTNTTNAM